MLVHLSITITQKLIAVKFATESGLLLKLGQYHEKYEVAKFECAAFSRYSEERETLFFGGETVLKIKGALQWVGDVLMKYDRFMEPINAFSRMINGLSLMEQEIMRKRNSQKAMKVLIRDILRSLVLRRYECEAPKYIQDLVLFHHASTPRVRLLYHELLTEYKWLHCILKKDAADTLNIANIAVLFCHSDEVIFVMPDDFALTDAQCSAMIEDLLLISEMALTVKISFVWKSGMPQAVRTNLMNAFIPLLGNLGLYGKYCVHHFDANAASFRFEDDLIDVGSQEAMESRIESMIQQLTPKPKKKKVPELQPNGPNPEPLPMPKLGIRMQEDVRLRELYDAISWSELGSILPSSICREIAEFGSVFVDSAMLTNEEQRYLVEMIGSQDQMEQFKYRNWKLLCSTPRDKDTQKVFGSEFDGKGNTVCLVEVKETGWICGGYGSTEWRSTYYKQSEGDENAFLFVIRPKEKRKVFHRERNAEGDGFNFEYNTIQLWICGWQPDDIFDQQCANEVAGHDLSPQPHWKDYEVFQLGARE